MLATEKNNDNAIISEILEGRETALRRIYPIYANDFKAWVRKFTQCDDEEITDAYQEALIALYQNIVSGRLTQLTSSLKTYIFSIAYRKLQTALEKSRRISDLTAIEETDLPYDTNVLTSLIENEELTAQRHTLAKAFEQLSAGCRKVLDLYFYQNFSIPQIQEKLNYQTVNSVSVQKSRCLKSLRDIIENA